MDHAFIRRLKNSVSFIDFKDDTPKHCLDLGTGVSPSLAAVSGTTILMNSPHSSGTGLLMLRSNGQTAPL